MKDIKQLQATRIMIFPTDDIHLPSILRKESITVIEKKYGLERNKFPEGFAVPQNHIVLINGEFKVSGKVYIINEVIIEERRIILRCLGPSEVLDSFTESFLKTLEMLDLRDYSSTYTPIITTYETSCVCHIDFQLNSILNNRFNSFAKEASEKIPTYNSEFSIEPFSLRLKINYSHLPDELLKEKITLTEKFLIIEQREKTDPKDQIYYTSSPTDTKTHFELLKCLESK